MTKLVLRPAGLGTTAAVFSKGFVMNEDVVNIEIRKFLKKVGVTSQREIEKALQNAAEAGRLDGSGPLKVSMTLEITGLGLVHTVNDEIALE